MNLQPLHLQYSRFTNRKLWERFIEIANENGSFHGMTWKELRSYLDGVELKRTYILNPHAKEFVPQIPLTMNADEVINTQPSVIHL